MLQMDRDPRIPQPVAAELMREYLYRHSFADLSEGSARVLESAKDYRTLLHFWLQYTAHDLATAEEFVWIVVQDEKSEPAVAEQIKGFGVRKVSRSVITELFRSHLKNPYMIWEYLSEKEQGIVEKGDLYQLVNLWTLHYELESETARGLIRMLSTMVY